MGHIRFESLKVQKGKSLTVEIKVFAFFYL